MLQWLIRFPEFAEFNESFENSNGLVVFQETDGTTDNVELLKTSDMRNSAITKSTDK